ncbi:MAG: glycoside hydrolase family 15 protein [Acidobacteria bacterium]|nr:glycoside hydrolase family 15 protein [Acidobacteriota bacterium]MBV9146555.1 glycoside hydrolase family 15 protein [Acidobacteriota bacterium]MBV9436226.1 glycoside hydrolase family 15 protein [Acidobacteriota bacterium]
MPPLQAERLLYRSRVAPPIGDYGIIGDCRSAALISKGGSLDWLCWPWFDSGSIFAAILDVEKGGFWRIAPAGEYSSTRRYIPETNVLETEFRTAGGLLRVTDCMPVYHADYEKQHLIPDREVLRIVECVEGEVALDGLYFPSPKYGRCAVRWRKKDALGIRVEFKGGALWMRSDLPWEIRDGHAACNSVMRAGERRYCSLVMMEHGPAVLSCLGSWSDAALQQTISWWKKWASRCEYQGEFRDEVLRSALAGKLLNFAPSGATIAAPTMSLPERVGGDLNWDYRYCWLRDASMTVTAMFGLGYHDEAEAFIEWLLHSTNRTQPRLLVTYTVYGRLTPKEWELNDWKGYRESRPVRVGNDARKQLQLDVYGEVLSAAVQLDESNKRVDGTSARVLRGVGKYVHNHWMLPDKGIWEPRTPNQHHTHSKLMCWLAMDSLLRLHDGGLLNKINRDEIEQTLHEIRREIEQKAWNEERQTYTAIFEGEEVDASLLLLSKHGFEPADSSRMKSTYRRIREELGAGPGLLYRYRNDLSPGESAFGICCFWAAEYLALGGGTLEEAKEEFRKVLRYRNDLGLFGEEIHPETGEVIGNFPQGFTHVGLINAALTIAEREAKMEQEAKAA